MPLAAVRALGTLGVFAVSASGWGLWALRSFRLRMPATDRVLISHALGWGMMALPLLVLALSDLLYPAAMGVVVALGVVLACVEAQTLRDALAQARTWCSRGGSRGMVSPGGLSPSRLALVAALALFLLQLPGALGPPSEADSVRGELPEAKLWLQRHGAVFVPDYHFNQPPLAQLLFSLGLAVGPDSVPALIHWWIGAWGALAIFGLGRRTVGERAAAAGALIYAATPSMAYSTASSKQELFLSLFGWLALHGLLAWRGDRQPGWLSLSGVMAGLGAATKVMGLYTYPILGVLVVWAARDGRPLRQAWRAGLAAAATFGGAAVAVVLPWWLRNYALSGDPLWPVGFEVFGGRYVPPAMARYLHEIRDLFGVGRGLEGFVFGLWHVTQQYAAFNDPRAPMTPLFLLFLPALLLGWRGRPARERAALGAMAAFCGGVYAFWWSQPQLPRYLYPLWAVASLASGAAAAKLARWSRPARAGVAAGMGLAMALSVVVSVEFNRRFLPTLFGSESREAYLARSVSYYADFRAVSALTPADSRILVFESLSLYYLDRDYLTGLPPWEGLIDYEDCQSGNELLAPLREMGVTHILWVHRAGHLAQLFDGLWREGRLEEVYRNRNGRQVSSRTWDGASAHDVVLWRVRYPLEAGR